jgi:hypothetical protein
MPKNENSPREGGPLGEPKLVVVTKPEAVADFLTATAPRNEPQVDPRVLLSREALDFGSKMLGARGQALEGEFGAHDRSSGVRVDITNTYGTMGIEFSLEYDDSPDEGQQIDLTGTPIFVLTDSTQKDGCVVHPAEFRGGTAEVPNIHDAYYIEMSPHFGTLQLDATSAVTTTLPSLAELEAGSAPTNLVASGASKDGVISIRVFERQPGQLQVSFSCQPREFSEKVPGSITVEEGSRVFFAFVDAEGNKLDLSKGKDPEMLASQGSADLSSDGTALSGICDKTFRNIPQGARIVFLISSRLSE